MVALAVGIQPRATTKRNRFRFHLVTSSNRPAHQPSVKCMDPKSDLYRLEHLTVDIATTSTAPSVRGWR